MDGKRRILIIDDHPLIREGLAQIINQQGDMGVVAEASNGEEALAYAKEFRPEVALLDISLKESSGLGLIADLKKACAGIRVLVVSMHDESVFAIRALRMGAQGYIMKTDGSRRVIEGIRAVLEDRVYVGNSVQEQILKGAGSKHVPGTSPADCLSIREMEVFELIGKGSSTREIAAALKKSINTIGTHRERIMKKLFIQNAAELACRAVLWVRNDRG